jgi:hypothetical protein
MRILFEIVLTLVQLPFMIVGFVIGLVVAGLRMGFYFAQRL